MIRLAPTLAPINLNFLHAEILTKDVNIASVDATNCAWVVRLLISLATSSLVSEPELFFLDGMCSPASILHKPDDCHLGCVSTGVSPSGDNQTESVSNAITVSHSFLSPSKAPWLGFLLRPELLKGWHVGTSSFDSAMSNGSWTAFLSWAILASLVRRATSSVLSLRLSLMVLVSSVFFVSSLELRPPAVYQMERGTPTRRV